MKPFTLKQAQALVDHASTAASDRHARWAKLEHLFRTGRADGDLIHSDVPGELWKEMPGLTLDAINYVLPHLSMILETVVARDPELIVEPWAGGPQAEDHASAGEVTLRYYWRRLGVTRRVLRDMTQDTVVLGNGFCKVGWAHASHDEDRDPNEVVADLAALLQADRLDAQLARRDPTPADELVERVTLVESVITMDEPYVEYVSPFDMLLPDNARRMAETPWVAQRLVLPLQDVQDNTAFAKAARDELQVDHGQHDSEDRPDGRERSPAGDIDGTDPFAEVEVFEFYDMRSRRLLVFQPDAEHALFDGAMPYSHRHPPFVHIRNFNDGGRRFWSFGDLENVAALQHQLNEYVFEQMDNARRSGNKYIVDQNVFTKEVRALFETDQPDVVIPVDLREKMLAEVFQHVKREGLSSDVYAAKDDCRAAMAEVLGLNDFQQGGVGADRMSATAAAVVDGTATIRAGGKREQVEEAAAHTGLLILLLCQEFMDAQRAVRIAGPLGAEWVDVDRADLQGEYGVKVETGSTQAVNPSTRQQKALELIANVIPALEAAGYDSTYLWRVAIRDLGYDPDQALKQAEQAEAPAGPGPAAGAAVPQPNIPQELMGGPPVPAATRGDIAL